MNKLFKTLSAVIIAVAMCFSIAAFAACDDDNKPETSKNPSNPDTPAKPGGEEDDGDDDIIIGSTPEITAFLQTLAAQETKCLQFNMSTEATSRTDGYHVYYSGENIGEKINDGYTYLEDKKSAAVYDGKLDVAGGNGDIIVSSNFKDKIYGSD